MSLQPSITLGHYEVTAKLGEGGMGEVWRARDTKLDRDVALKVLPQAFTDDPDRLARFEREAKVLASLNHPNIAAIHGLEESDGTQALVLELVEGPTLADRISQGPIPLDEALPIAKQIAEALEAAHEAGIIHRDLKPANIKVTPEEIVKVLDFGLAKALEPEVSEADAANSPTMTAAATKMGVIMGTAAYMSPEQAKGRMVDKRTDIWAFGAVLYEMLTAQRAFPGEDVSESLATVIKSDPDWTALPDETPTPIRRLLRRCLEKDRRERLPDAAVARIEIRDALAVPDLSKADSIAVAPLAVWQRPRPLLLAGLAVAIISGLTVWSLTRPAPTPPALVSRTSIVLPPHMRTNPGNRGVAISPAGTHVVYVADAQLYVRALDALDVQPLAGTEGRAPASPFFSPDGQWVGFYSARDNALQKVALAGGAAVTVAETAPLFGASWGADDTIVFGQEPDIFRVAGTGGTPDLLVSVDPPARAYHPQMLPGGEAVLYTLAASARAWDTAQIVVEQLATGERTVLVEGGSDARYLPTGHLVYVLRGTLLAVPFDVERLAVTGGPVPLVEGVRIGSMTGAVEAGISQTGTLVYQPGRTAEDLRTLVWVDRQGAEEAVAVEPRAYVYPRISPDGSRVALDTRDTFDPQGEDDIWIWDIARGTVSLAESSPALDAYPVWYPDGQRLAFGSNRAGQINLYSIAADGGSVAEQLAEDSVLTVPQSMAPDGERLLVRRTHGANTDLALVSLGDGGAVTVLLDGDYHENNGRIAPDGRWLAYQSDETGRPEVYVRPFPDVNAERWQVSVEGGTQPVWARDGSELFYIALDGRLMAVPLRSGETFTAGLPVHLFDAPWSLQADVAPGWGTVYDVSPDGQRFLMVKRSSTESSETAQFVVLHNLFDELKARAPTGQN